LAIYWPDGSRQEVNTAVDRTLNLKLVEINKPTKKPLP
jgi:hypothetical protein